MSRKKAGKHVVRAAVEAAEHESFEALLRRFKKAVNRAGIILQVKKRSYFVSPSEIKHIKKSKAKKKKLKSTNNKKSRRR